MQVRKHVLVLSALLIVFPTCTKQIKKHTHNKRTYDDPYQFTQTGILVGLGTGACCSYADLAITHALYKYFLQQDITQIKERCSNIKQELKRILLFDQTVFTPENQPSIKTFAKHIGYFIGTRMLTRMLCWHFERRVRTKTINKIITTDEYDDSDMDRASVKKAHSYGRYASWGGYCGYITYVICKRFVQAWQRSLS